MMGLTTRQTDCLEAIRAHIAKHEVSPTVRELVAVMGVSSNGRVVELIRALEERGYISTTPNKARSIRIVEDAETMRHRSDAELWALVANAQAELRRRAS